MKRSIYLHVIRGDCHQKNEEEEERGRSALGCSFHGADADRACVVHFFVFVRGPGCQHPLSAGWDPKQASGSVS